MSHKRATSLDVNISDVSSNHSEKDPIQNQSSDFEDVIHVAPVEDSRVENDSDHEPVQDKPQWLPLPQAPRGTHLDLSLPPIGNITEAFEDLSRKAIDLGLREILERLSGQSIKVATMCSGTETPIVALDLIKECLKHMGHELNYEHVFSAEIVPWKQNWILRNFEPRMLFRDITEMDKSSAMTVFGELAHIPPPGSVHVLVAGFACVDFSLLNNRRKELIVNLDELPPERLLELLGGESSVTLAAILRYARQYRPPILILENILGASWAQIIDLFKQIGYTTGVVKLDTKHFYIPQTRQRGYLLCVSHQPRKGVGGLSKPAAESVMPRWTDIIRNLMRPASSPVDDFLFPDSHPDLLQSIQKQVLESGAQWETEFAKDWSVCWGRYQRFRVSNHLGGAAPYTRWSSGVIKPPGHANTAWLRVQPNRIKDTIDCLYLLSAQSSKRNYDASYKSRFPDTSQNIDRSLDTAKPGIVGCITPNNLIFHMGKGRPPTGLEMLKLQGLNADRLLIGRETQRQLRDLAGNAMSTTVVGSAIIAALIAGFAAIDSRTLGKCSQLTRKPWKGDSFRIDPRSELYSVQTVDFGPLETLLSKRHFCELAGVTARHCYCESQWSRSTAVIGKCRECGHTACSNCRGNPAHSLEEMHDRPPYDTRFFTSTAFRYLPTRLQLHDFGSLQSLVLDVINGVIIKEKLALLSHTFEIGLEKATKERLVREKAEKWSKSATLTVVRPTAGARRRNQGPSDESQLCLKGSQQDSMSAATYEGVVNSHPEFVLGSYVALDSETGNGFPRTNPSQRDIDSVLRQLTNGNLDGNTRHRNCVITKSIINIRFEDEELLMSAPKRSHLWTVVYESERLKLKLVIKNNTAEWVLYAKSPRDLAAGSMVRSILAQPIASMIPDLDQDGHSIWTGKWRAHIYNRCEHNVRIQAQGKLIPSWKAEIGLRQYQNDKIYDELHITPAEHDIGNHHDEKGGLGRICGSYQLLRYCGSATRSLYRQTLGAETGLKPLYLFLNSRPNQASNLDEYVISEDHERLPDNEDHRSIARITTLVGIDSHLSKTTTDNILPVLINSLSRQDRLLVWQYLTCANETVRNFEPDPNILLSTSHSSPRNWRPSREASQIAQVVFDHHLRAFDGSLKVLDHDEEFCTTMVAPEVLVKPLKYHDSTEALLQGDQKLDNCRSNDALLLKYSFPWHGRNADGHFGQAPIDITELNQRGMQLDIEWLTNRIDLGQELTTWNVVVVNQEDFRCIVCSPPLPAYVLRQTPTGGLLPMEDPEAVLRYLKLWKTKPRPFTISTQRRNRHGHDGQDLCVTINVQCLIHRLLAGLAMLPAYKCISQEVSWRICTDITLDKYIGRLGCLRVHDCTREVPLNYTFGISNLALRRDQARVFHWMKGRDTMYADPFQEVIVEESVSAHLRWSVEAQIMRSVVARGGLCADHVGFGKTVVTLAVIRAHMDQARKEAEARIFQGPASHIPVRATLILVPGALAYQWADEISRFWTGCEWILISSMDDLFRYSVRDIQNVDVVIASTDLLQRDKDVDYTNRIAEIAGMADPASFTSPRQYAEWIKKADANISEFVKDFRDPEITHAQCLDNLQERAFQNLLATRGYLEKSQRLRGRKFVANQRAQILNFRRSFKSLLSSHTQGRVAGDVSGFRTLRSGTDPMRLSNQNAVQQDVETSSDNSNNTDSDATIIDDPRGDYPMSVQAAQESAPIKRKRRQISVLSSRKRSQDGTNDMTFLETDDTETAVTKDLVGPVLSMFHFHRKILDEISYLNAYQESAIKSIPSNITWLLSGTTRLRDVMDVKWIASMVGVHIGPDDDSEGHYAIDNRKAVDAHRSEPEKIEASKTIHTTAWHKRRLITSQAFLDKFSRMNLVELPATAQVRVKEIIFGLRLPALHAILYHESRALLLSQSFKDNLTFIGLGRHDRSLRLHFVLHRTNTTEEALIRASFHVSRAEGYSLMQHRCHELPDLEYNQVLDTRVDDVLRITRAVARRVNEFIDWLENGLDYPRLDKKEANYLFDVVKRATWLIQVKLFRSLRDTDASDQFHRIHSKASLPHVDYRGMTPKEARRRLDKLAKLIDAMVSSVRALRFLRNARRLQEMDWNRNGGSFIDDLGHLTCLKNARLNGLCGHLICRGCMDDARRSVCPVAGCGAGASHELMVHAQDLGESSASMTTSSVKIQTVIDIVKALKKDSQALVFCQWHDINEILIHHLERAGIHAKYIREGESTTAGKVTSFKNLDYGHANWTKVLVLDPSSATAAGHNLQNVNAIIFLTPLSGSSIDEYKASYAQAIGRAARFGQKNIVAVYHLLVSRTAEVNVHESRRGTKLYENNGKVMECRTGEFVPGDRELALEGYLPYMPV